MRISLIVLGVIFIVVGGVLYYMPTPTAGAVTTTLDKGTSNTKTSYASISLPMQVTISSLIIGAILLVLGLLIPDHTKEIINERDASAKDYDAKKGSKDYSLETKERITDDGKRVRESRERIERAA